MRRRVLRCLLVVLAAGSSSGPARAESADELLRRARDAWSTGKPDEALDLAGRAIAADPQDARGPYFRGVLRNALGRYADAVADFDRCLKLDPKLADAYDLRGSAQFKSGKFAEAVADFDRFLALRPKEAPGHWRRGIALYYVGRCADGRDQFKGYQSVDANDVENAVWHFLCVAKLEGVAKARAAMLRIGKDRRVPMTEVYELYRGKLRPADVLAAAEAGDVKPEERASRRFYAHLYLGLYYDATGEPQKALEHMTLAAGKYGSPGYMGDVARVHERVLREAAKGK